ncbi:hypothetical protein [uncultured Sphaerochaeta sp.]|uniref:hypothetical protein n=1 Tax=uncultured Sphaerochaeta sp. TaxID=886478 RepID=UPI002A0A0F5E|nr:hypothetical protein [uncultured Sphaerochaeta sp.]
MIEIYALPLVCLLLNFLAFAACLRFLFSRQGLYWIVPLFLTFFILWPNALNLYRVASNATQVSLPYSYLDLQPLLLSLFWYAMIVTFHFALKKTIRVNHYEEQVRKNLHEARYQMAVEMMIQGRKEKRRRQYYTKAPASAPVLDAYSSTWTDLFDQR